MFSLLVCCAIIVLMTIGSAAVALLYPRKKSSILSAFSGGVILGAALLHMLPEASSHIPQYVGLYVLCGLLMVFLLERTIVVHFCEHEEDCQHSHFIGYAFYGGLLIHCFIDGVVMGSGATVPQLGIPVFLAIITHKLPVMFSLAGVLLSQGMNVKKVFFWIGILSIVTPVGAILAYSSLNVTGGDWQYIAVAISIGTFLYISLTHFLSSLSREQRNIKREIVALMFGLLWMGIVKWVVGE